MEEAIAVIRNELLAEAYQDGLESIQMNENADWFTPENASVVQQYLKNMRDHYLDKFNEAVRKKENLMYLFETHEDFQYDLNEYKNKYYNENLADLVRNVSLKDRIIEYDGHLIQQIDPIFQQPEKYRTDLREIMRFFTDPSLDHSMGPNK